MRLGRPLLRLPRVVSALTDRLDGPLRQDDLIADGVEKARTLLAVPVGILVALTERQLLGLELAAGAGDDEHPAQEMIRGRFRSRRRSVRRDIGSTLEIATGARDLLRFELTV